MAPTYTNTLLSVALGQESDSTTKSASGEIRYAATVTDNLNTHTYTQKSLAHTDLPPCLSLPPSGLVNGRWNAVFRYH